MERSVIDNLSAIVVSKELNAFVLKRVKHPSIASDIVSEVAEKIFTAHLPFTEIRNPKAWIYKITENTCKDYWKKNQSFLTLEKVSVENTPTPNSYHLAGLYVGALIQLLPKKYREPLVLHELHQKRQIEIASHLHLTLPAVKSRVVRGRSLLKSMLISCCHFKVNNKGTLVSFQIKDNCKALQKVRQEYGFHLELNS